jgi:hypothetical protein
MKGIDEARRDSPGCGIRLRLLEGQAMAAD